MSDVFVSHVEEDTDIALEIAIGLEESGYSTWSYEVDSIPGPSYLIQTGEAVEASKAVIVVISPHSLGSRQVTSEVIRAHETNKRFIPVLRDIKHAEFQNRQPEWREAMGASASINIPKGGVATILPRITNGLRALDILASNKTDTVRVVQIRGVLDELKGHSTSGKGELKPVPATTPKAEPITVEVPPIKTADGVKKRKRWIKPTVIASIVILVLLVIGAVGSRDRQEFVTIFFDDFESGELTDWQVANIRGEAKINEESGNHFLDSTGFALCSAGDTSWTDYRVELEFVLIKGEAIIRLGHGKYETDGGNVKASYWVTLSPDNARLSKIENLRDKPGEEESIDLADTLIGIKLGAWYGLVVEYQKNKLILYIDAERVLSYEDIQSPTLSGAIAVGTLDEAHALFDDIRIDTLIRE
ncbi:toll/interleukin-1 receptor domain-containing protein [Chloroflexota bacterium]